MTADTRRPGPDRFLNVTLTTHEGTEVRFYDDLIKGKTVAIDLIYTTCEYACPLETAKMAQVQRLLGDRMGRDIFFYSITIDPEHDTPAVLKEYAERYRAGPGWLFLTGKKTDIDLLSRKLGLYTPPDPSNPDGHVPYLLVGNEATGQGCVTPRSIIQRSSRARLATGSIAGRVRGRIGCNRTPRCHGCG